PGTGAAHKGFTWLYDAAGNNTSRQSEHEPVGSTMTLSRLDYNNLNQLSARTANGNLPARFRGTVNEPATVTVAGQSAALAPNPASHTGGEVFTATANLRADHASTVEIVATDFGANGGHQKP